MIVVALLLVVAAGVIAWDGYQAWVRYRGAPARPETAPAPTAPTTSM
jgi:hypothetical protein